MNVKNYLKLLDFEVFDDFSIKVKTWDIYKGFTNYNHNNKECQNFKVVNVVIRNKYNEIEIQAKQL